MRVPFFGSARLAAATIELHPPTTDRRYDSERKRTESEEARSTSMDMDKDDSFVPMKRRAALSSSIRASEAGGVASNSVFTRQSAFQ